MCHLCHQCYITESNFLVNSTNIALLSLLGLDKLLRLFSDDVPVRSQRCQQTLKTSRKPLFFLWSVDRGLVIESAEVACACGPCAWGGTGAQRSPLPPLNGTLGGSPCYRFCIGAQEQHLSVDINQINVSAVSSHFLGQGQTDRQLCVDETMPTRGCQWLHGETVISPVNSAAIRSHVWMWFRPMPATGPFDHTLRKPTVIYPIR